MTFLNPIFWWASLAVLIPIIVHLFNFRRPKKILFSDISFVKEVKKSVVRRIRLKQWLLLAARILAILALVAVFAKPVLKKETGSGLVVGANSIAIILDNSYSMKGGNEKGSYWLQAKKIAGDIINAYSENDEFLIMTSSDLKLHYNFGERLVTRKELGYLPVKQNQTSLGDVLTLQEDLFSQAANPNRILYFISDFQESTVLADSQYTNTAPENLLVNLVPLSTRPLKNVYISGHEITSRIIEKEKPVNFKLKLVNDSEEPARNLGVRLVSGTQSRPVATADLSPGEVKEVEFNVIPKTSGWQAGYMEVDDNPVDFDNRRYFSYYVPDKEKMLIVEEQQVPNFRLIFSQDILSQFDVEFINYRQFASVELDQFKSIVLLGVTELSTGMQEKLSVHLEQGKGILIFPGKDAKKSLDNFLLEMKVGVLGDQVDVENGQYASSVDLEHPVFDGVFVNSAERKKFDAPLVYKHYKFQPANAVVQSTILKLSNQDPVLVESEVGAGVLYLWTLFPGEAWTDLTVKSSGFTLLIQLARMMNQSRQVEQNQDLGNLTFKRIKTTDKDLIKLVGEEGNERIPLQYPQSGYFVLDFDTLQLKEGNYDLVQKEDFLEKISFNIPDAESKLKAQAKKEIEDLVSQAGLQHVRVTGASGGEIQSDIRFQSAGVPLWKYFLIGAIVFFLLEFLILRMKENS